jgi:thymidine kinase
MAKLYFIYSAMNAGKSTSLLQVAHNYEERGQRVILLKPNLDTRSTMIESRLGISRPAIGIDISDNVFTLLSGYDKVDCVLIDEAQFLTEKQVIQLCSVVDTMNIPVMCYGIRTDFMGALFTGSCALLAHADVIREQVTVCDCGRKATHISRFDSAGNVVRSGPQILPGAESVYKSFCRRCWINTKTL